MSTPVVSATAPRPLRRSDSPRKRRALGLVAVLAAMCLMFAGCATEAAPLDAETTARFDVANNAIADLTDGSGEGVPRPELIRSISRARDAGAMLRIVIAPADGTLVSAESVVDRYGGTAISYQVDTLTFESASREISGEQLDRAVLAAKQEVDIADSVAAFVAVLENEGVDEAGTSIWNRLALGLLLVAAAFMLWGAWSYAQARRRRMRRQEKFRARKAVLVDWAAQLGPEVESLRPLVGTSPDSSKQQIWHDAHQFVGTIGPTLESARTTGELDVAEMRIGRTAIKLRDLRQALTS